MMGATHIAVSVTFGILVASNTDLVLEPLSWLFLLIGTLAPDLDSGNALISKPGSLFDRFLPRSLVVLLDTIGVALSKVVKMLFGHRTAVHWPIWAIVFIIAGQAFQWNWLLWFGWGYLLHILGDFCTKAGAPLFGPLYCKNIKWSPMRTGSWMERCLAICLWTYIVFAGQAVLPTAAQDWLQRYSQIAINEVADGFRENR